MREYQMNKALSVLLIIAVAAGIVPLARSIKASSLPRGVATSNLIPTGEAQPAECPNARHTPLYGI
jgi:hypothetical protein